VGANYRINNAMAVFARNSQGGRANADRLLFSPYINRDGTAVNGLKADGINQTELCLKWRKNKYTLNATGFYALISEQNYEVTRLLLLNRRYTAFGLELDGTAEIGNLTLRGGLTYTNSKITRDELNPAMEGKTPRRQAPIIYQLMSAYKVKNHSVGLSVIGTAASYAQDDNKLVMPAYAYLNAFINLALTERMTLSFNANNLLSQMGITESEEGSIVSGQTNFVRARSIAGRTISSSLRIMF
jgi:outer membrane receptor protein involved in Fe transport